MKYYIYSFFFFFSYLNTFGQLTKLQLHTIDSLKQTISSAAHDTNKIAAYNAWDNIIYMSDPKLDQELNQEIVAIAEKNLKNQNLTVKEKYSFKKSLALALNSLGIIFYNKGENTQALDFYSRSLKLREAIGDKKGIAATLNNLGIVYQDQAENVKAIECYTHSRKINEAIGDKNGEANCLSNIGRIYYELEDIDKAFDYQSKSLKIREAIGDKKGMAIAYNNIGTLYLDEKNTEKALEYFNRYLKIGEELGDKNKIALALDNIGSVYEKKEDNVKALEYFNHSLSIFKETENKKWESALLSKVGNIYIKTNDKQKALEFYKEALSIAQDAGSVTSAKDASKALYTLFKATGHFADALKMHELYIEMRDSIRNENNQKEALKQELKYTYNKQKAFAAKEHEKEMEISAEREQAQKSVIYAVSIVLILVIALTVFIVNRLRFTRRQKHRIEIQKNMIEAKQKEIFSSIAYAKRLQEAILPTEEYVKSQLPESLIYYKPKDIVAGDFYWIERKEDLLLIAVADCTGHGIPGAIISVICSNALNRAVVEFGITEPGSILSKTRELVLETFSRSDKDVKDGMDISLLCINTKANKIEWSGANIPLWYISGEKLVEIKANKQPIGKTDKPVPFTTHSIPFNKGDMFFLFSDGYADQFGGSKGKKFKSKALKKTLLQNSSLTCNEQKKEIERIFTDWIGNLEQIDDVCVLGLKI